MVWIHGGGFTMGTGRSYDPSLMVSMYNVVMVTVNYRLGVLGFFNIPGTDIKGNYGMHDQVCTDFYFFQLLVSPSQVGHLLPLSPSFFYSSSLDP